MMMRLMMISDAFASDIARTRVGARRGMGYCLTSSARSRQVGGVRVLRVDGERRGANHHSFNRLRLRLRRGRSRASVSVCLS